MNLASIPQLYRNANRWREILAVLSKHGLADWLDRIDLLVKRRSPSELETGPAHRQREGRVRRALEELGPTFIKLGQVLATRPDLVGVELANELIKLQTDAPADSPERVRKTLEASLGRSIESCYASFEEIPIASGSIGQVHRATLRSGESVAVKIRHHGIASQIAVDTDILLGLAELAEGINDWKPYRPQATVREFERTLRRELDFRDEQRRIHQFQKAFADDERLRIPTTFPDFSTEHVLTLEWLEGCKIATESVQGAPAEELATAARRGAEIFLEMIFEHGLYHADPHPGNLLVMPGGVVGLLDFGMVGRLNERLREDLEEVLVAVATNDAERLASALLRVGQGPVDLDEEDFLTEVTDYIDHYGNQAIGGFNISGAITELFHLVRRRKLVLSPQLAMLLKLLVMLEGTARLLEPDFSLLEVIEPMQKRILLRRFSPRRQARRAQRIYSDLEQLAEETPRRLRDLLRQIQGGKLEVHLEHRGLEPSVNRLVLGLVTSALIVGSSLMFSGEVLPVRGISVPGTLGFVLSGLLGIRLVWAIRKSGWLDSQ